jgi:YgiT-type zinc finger domain-containing protein
MMSLESPLPPTVIGSCPCRGSYELRKVEVRMTVDGETVTLPDVPQGACPRCGSRVYRARVVEELEAVMRGERVTLKPSTTR